MNSSDMGMLATTSRYFRGAVETTTNTRTQHVRNLQELMSVMKEMNWVGLDAQTICTFVYVAGLKEDNRNNFLREEANYSGS